MKFYPRTKNRSSLIIINKHMNKISTQKFRKRERERKK